MSLKELFSEVPFLRLKPRIDPVDYQEKLEGRRQTLDGKELPDPVPMAPPVGYKRQPSMVEHIRSMVRSERLRMEAEAAGMESFEDADDFDVPDDPEPASRYEVPDDLEPPASLRQKQADAKAKAAEEAAEPPSDGGNPAPKPQAEAG